MRSPPRSTTPKTNRSSSTCRRGFRLPEASPSPSKAENRCWRQILGVSKPNAHYSLFENHFDQTPVSFTPMDGVGKTNSFVAQPDGRAKVSMTLPDFPTHANAVLLVYDSDGQTHGLERGRIGIDAHHQLIARPE